MHRTSNINRLQTCVLAKGISFASLSDIFAPPPLTLFNINKPISCGIHHLSHNPVYIWSKSATYCVGYPFYIYTEIPGQHYFISTKRDIRHSKQQEKKWQEEQRKSLSTHKQSPYRQLNLNIFIGKTNRIIH